MHFYLQQVLPEHSSLTLGVLRLRFNEDLEIYKSDNFYKNYDRRFNFRFFDTTNGFGEVIEVFNNPKIYDDEC